MHDLNIVSVYVRGLNSVEKRNVFYKWLEQNNFDVVLLQETHYVEKKEKYDFIWNGISFHNFSDSPYSRGVSILFRKEIDINIIKVHRSNDARKLLINVKIYDNLITFIKNTRNT